jgi:exosortase
MNWSSHVQIAAELPTAVSEPSRMWALPASLFLFASLALLYWQVAVELVSDWVTDDNYSHGFLIVPLALYLAWERRHQLALAERDPSTLGLLAVSGGVGLLIVGTLGAEMFLTRISMVPVIAGAVLFVLGWSHLKLLAYPIGILLLMIPVPEIVFNQIAFPLQLLASAFGEWALSTLGIPVLREGNVITLAHTQLEVAEACSGIRSLISLITLGIVYGYFSTPSTALRIVLTLGTIPIAIVANALRVAGTGVAAHLYGPEAAEGFFHSFSGWLVFVAALATLFVVHRLLRWLLPLFGIGTAAESRG